MMNKADVASLVDRVAREVVKDLGIKDPKDVGDKAIQAAYARLWMVDKMSVEMCTDRFTVEQSLHVAARVVS